MKTFRILFLSMLAIFFIAGNASAVPTLDNILTGVSTPYADTGAEYVYLTDTDGTSDDAVATLLLESAGFASSNTFGIFDFTVESGVVTVTDTLEVFNGASSSVTSATVAFDLSAGTATNSITEATANIDSSFGFYITTPEGENGYTYYSITSLNADSYDHALLFDTSDNTEGSLLGADVVVAFEDLFNGGDDDFNDMVIGVSDVKPVPEPATLLLVGAGLLGLAGYGRRKTRK